MLSRRCLQVAAFIVIVRRHLLRAKGDADTARARVVHFALGSNDRPESRGRLCRCRCRCVNRFFRVRRRVIRLDLLVLLDRCQRRHRWVINDTGLVPVTLLLLVLHVEHLYRFLRGPRRRGRRRRYRGRQRFVGLLDDDLDNWLRFGRVIVQRSLLVEVVALGTRQRIVEWISLGILNDRLHLNRIWRRPGSSPRIECNLLSLIAAFRGLIFGKGRDREGRCH